jgi:hypothetical protein
LKASVEVGVTRLDYQHKLQDAAAAELKAQSIAYAGRALAQCHFALDEYKLAGSLWDLWWWDGHSVVGDIERDRPVSTSDVALEIEVRSDRNGQPDVFEVDMLKQWNLASRCLNEFAACKQESSTSVQQKKKKPIDWLPRFAEEAFKMDTRQALHGRCYGMFNPDCVLKTYELNEVAAEQYFKGNRLVFSGYEPATVDKIGRDLVGKSYITLRTSKRDPRSVQAFFQSDAVPAQLQPDDRVAIECTVSCLMPDLMLEDCIIYDVMRWSGSSYDRVKLQ